MKKYEIVRTHEDFNEVINHGNKVSNRYFVIFYASKEEWRPHFGIAVGKKLGNAVARNKFKRQVRNMIDNHKLLFKNYHNYIIMIKKDAVGVSFAVLEKYFVNLLTKGNI